MKKGILLVIVVILIIPFKLFSSDGDVFYTSQQINLLIDRKLEPATRIEINNLAQSLTSGQRLAIYKANTISNGAAGGASLLSYFVGFGTGSFALGDVRRGRTFLIMDTLCLAGIIGSSVVSASRYGEVNPLTYICALGLFITRLIELGAPSTFREEYNALLLDTLLSDPSAFFAISPEVDNQGKFRTTLSAKIEF